MCLLASQKRLENKYKDPNMLPKVNKADMADTKESMEKYLRSHHGVVRAPLAYIIRKTIMVQVYDDYSKYVSPDDKMIAMMLHQPPDKSKLHNKQSVQSVIKHTAVYEIDNRSVYDILDQICKDTDLYLYVKQHTPKRD